MLNIQDIETFFHILSAGTLSAAAKKQGVSQTTMGRVLDRLEQELGLQLAHRSKRGLVLTPAGELFAARAKTILMETQKLQSEVSTLAREAQGVVRLSACRSWARRHLGKMLATFQQEHPQVHVDLSLEDRWLDLDKEGVDLAIRTGQPPLQSNSRVTRLPDHGFTLVASPTYLKQHPAPQAPKDLQEHTICALVTQTKWVKWPLKKEGGVVEVEVQPKLETGDIEMLLSLALGGFGVTALPDYMVVDHVKRGELSALMRSWHFPKVPVLMLHAQSSAMSGSAKALKQHIQANITPQDDR